MTPGQELTHFLRRHNAAAFGKATSAGLMAVAAWVLVPAGFAVVFHIFSRLLVVGGAWPPQLLLVLVYPVLNALVLLWRVVRGVELNYDGPTGIWHLVFWPAYLTAEVIAQWRRLEHFSPGERAEAQSFLLRARMAGMDGFLHRPTPAERSLLNRLEGVGAVRITLPHADAIRVAYRNPLAESAVPTEFDVRDLPPVGLIAGGGQLPLLEAAGLHTAGRKIAGIGLRGQYDPALPSLCDSFTEISPLRPGAWVRHLHKQDAFEAVMVGHVQKTRIYNPWDILRNCPDFLALHLLFVRKRHDRRSQGLLAALAGALKDKGLLLVSTTQYIPEHLATHGPMTRRKPSEDQLRDIQFALPMLRTLNEQDIGQGLCVKGGDVIALEAMEGTDRMIARAGELCRRGGWTLVKGSDSTKDLRFDVPTVGLSTIENLKKAGAGCLAVVAGCTILVDKPEVLAAADKAGIAVFGVELE